MDKKLFSASASASTDLITIYSLKKAMTKFQSVTPPRQVLIISEQDSKTLKAVSDKFNDSLDDAIMRGIPVFQSKYLPTRNQVQRRTHRRSRINKKWRKRYGFKPLEKFAYVIDPAFLSLNYFNKPNFINFKD